ncbi:hypothetical protein LZ32DRAFT_661686 [Colletotrichum eremochloae]|nr:hypothetical protein LZ32DRAFT_661686 [Colletotrichum eremochloae]
MEKLTAKYSGLKEMLPALTKSPANPTSRPFYCLVRVSSAEEAKPRVTASVASKDLTIADNDETKVERPELVYQVQNPRLIYWTFDLLHALRLHGVSGGEWVRRLRASNSDNPDVQAADILRGQV